MTALVDAPPDSSPGPPARGRGRGRRLAVVASFLAPALVVLGALVVYPIVYTLIQSFYGTGGGFVGWDNYVTMFTNDSTFTAIRNNIIWVIVAPASCTILGLIFAVLLEKLSWKAAFRLIIFMPMAISMLAAGVIFRGMFQENPNQGVVNAVIVGVHDAVTDESNYPGAQPREDVGIGSDRGVIASDAEIATGQQQNFPLVAIRPNSVPDAAVQAAQPPPAGPSEVTGTVFLDVIRGGGGTDGRIEPGKLGLPGVHVDAVNADGTVAGSAKTGPDGTFVLSGLDPGSSYRIALPASNFSEGFDGVSWLSSTFITAVIILSYIWIWAGFAMVMISSGLSAIDRSLQEASRIDGANEWQVFTKITAPLLSPVLIVVFITLVINVLKIFDLVYVIPPGASKPAANVIAVEMWTVSFGGGNDMGLGSALSILLLVLVLPSMIINIRRFKEERTR
ncbi:ABC transporter permease subunit [Pseudactinotalea sp. HY158]|uniref:ABC transporter permease subunit n=1 Tax=Pseudactinotalea sp. HY158 TaxID=2654547 RepID=UPI00129CEB60|nr:ABC transporter permease subunit [Pseudactinotalea sp. HY158]QGH68786.1 ABC transporter permease subunit [Pseudactinotalea sp. HY158]